MVLIAISSFTNKSKTRPVQLMLHQGHKLQQEPHASILQWGRTRGEADLEDWDLGWYKLIKQATEVTNTQGFLYARTDCFPEETLSHFADAWASFEVLIFIPKSATHYITTRTPDITLHLPVLLNISRLAFLISSLFIVYSFPQKCTRTETLFCLLLYIQCPNHSKHLHFLS